MRNPNESLGSLKYLALTIPASAIPLSPAIQLQLLPPMPVKARAILKDIKEQQAMFNNGDTENQPLPRSSTPLWPYTDPSLPLTRTKVPCVRLMLIERVSHDMANCCVGSRRKAIGSDRSFA